MGSVKIEDLASLISEGLEGYSAEIAKEVKRAADKTAKEARKSLESASPEGRRKQYEKGWQASKSFESTMEKRVTVHNRTDPQLTHLLEYGHILKRGGRSIGAAKPKPHIKAIEEKANADFEKRCEEAIKRAGS